MMLNATIPMRRARLTVSACLVLLAAAACGGDGPTEPVQTAGSISFTYSGSLSGSFAATGTLDPDADQPPEEGAGAFTDVADGIMLVIGIRTLSESRADLVEFFLPIVTTPQTLRFDPVNDECFFSATSCPFALIGLGLDTDDVDPLASDPENLFFMTAGSIVVTSVSATRITGTFQGSASNLTLDEEERVIVITNGTFDVPVRSIED